jgi:uncharacterized protein (DUF3820 family)
MAFVFVLNHDSQDLSIILIVIESRNPQILVIMVQNDYYLYTVQNLQPDPKILIDIVQTRMPYGKYKGTIIADIPISYLEWMAGKGFTKDKMGMLLSTTFEIKTNGLSEILHMVKRSLSQSGGNR